MDRIKVIKLQPFIGRFSNFRKKLENWKVIKKYLKENFNCWKGKRRDWERKRKSFWERKNSKLRVRFLCAKIILSRRPSFLPKNKRTFILNVITESIVCKLSTGSRRWLSTNYHPLSTVRSPNSETPSLSWLTKLICGCLNICSVTSHFDFIDLLSNQHLYLSWSWSFSERYGWRDGSRWNGLGVSNR